MQIFSQAFTLSIFIGFLSTFFLLFYCIFEMILKVLIKAFLWWEVLADIYISIVFFCIFCFSIRCDTERELYKLVRCLGQRNRALLN